MYIVYNVSNMPVPLPDLRVEVAPNEIIDLERFADRSRIDSSASLQAAMRRKVLRLGRHSVVYSNVPQVMAHEPPVQETLPPAPAPPPSPVLSEDRLAAIIRSVVRDELKPSQAEGNSDIRPVVEQAVQRTVGDLVSEIRDRINSVGPAVASAQKDQGVDPARLAQIADKSVNRMTQDMQVAGPKQVRKIQIVNDNLDDLANELD